MLRLFLNTTLLRLIAIGWLFNALLVDVSADEFKVSDINRDGVVDAADAGMLFAQIGTDGGPNRVGDLNLDGIVDAADAGIFFSEWDQNEAESCAPTRQVLGDIDDDGDVDAQDGTRFIQEYEQNESVAPWSTRDFTGDGVVDQLDADTMEYYLNRFIHMTDARFPFTHIGETGEVLVDSSGPVPVVFSKPYKDPVVFLTPVSRNYQGPFRPRVLSVENEGFL